MNVYILNMAVWNDNKGLQIFLHEVFQAKWRKINEHVGKQPEIPFLSFLGAISQVGFQAFVLHDL